MKRASASAAVIAGYQERRGPSRTASWVSVLALASVLAGSSPGVRAQSAVNSAVETAGGQTPVATSAKLVRTNMAGVYAFTQPPAGFDPDTAPPEQLAAYGYPAKPDPGASPEAIAKWSAITKPTLQRFVPTLVQTKRYHKQVAGLRVQEENSTASSYNWAGYAIVTPAHGSPLYSVTGDWTVPTVQQPFATCSGGWDYSSQWVGIDGFINTDLFEAGSAADAFCDVGPQVTEYYPWLEWLPAAEIAIYQSINPITLFPFFPGDYVEVTVWATDWTNGASRTGNVMFTDVTQNWQVSLAFSAASVGGSKVVGQSAEWIVERTTVNGSPATLPNFTANPWVNLYASDLDQFTHTPAAPLKATPYNITMLDDFGFPIAYDTLYGNSALWFYTEGSSR